MKSHFLPAMLMLWAATASADETLVSAAWLQQHLSDPDLVLFHVGTRADFEKEHIRGAQLVVPQDLSIPRSEGALLMQLLPPEALRTKLESLGVSDDSRVVVYFGTDSMVQAARVYFSLDAAGLGERSSILDGGMPAWKAAGGAVTGEVSEPTPGKITALPRPELVLDVDEVQAGLKNSTIRLIDTRSADLYDGSNPGSMPRAGHIPGALNLPYASLASDDLILKSNVELTRIFEDAGIKTGDTVVTYCNSGQQATVVYLAAKRLGFKAKVYDGSWDEWSRRDDLKAETGPVK